MSDTWGKGSVNNNIGWGQAAGSATNDWGKSQKESWAGQTDIVGITSVSITYSSSAFCSDANDPTPTISNNAGAGTFSSTAGLVFISTTTGEVDISGSTAGSYVITYTDTDAATATFDLSINTIPTVTVSASAGTICDGESTILTASGANSYTWSNGGTGASITVSPSTTTLFTATGTDSNGCTSSGGTTITVNAQDSAAFSYAASAFCANGTNPSPTITGTAGGAFTSTAGITLNSSTGEIDLDASTVGTYSITYTTTGVCPDNQSTNITINAADNAAFAYSASSYEPTDADPTPTITGLTGGTFSGTTGLVINSTTGEIDLSASTVASHTITYDTTSSGSSVCPNTSTQTVDIALAGIANNYSMSFDGSDDYIDAGNSDSFSFGNGITDSPFSISAWVNMADATNFITIAKDANSGREYVIRTLSDDKLYFYLLDNVNGGYIGKISSGTVTSNQGTWIHTAYTYNGNSTSSGIKIYLNGSQVGNDNYEGGSYTAMSNTSTNLNIGRQERGLHYGSGLIDEVAVWNTALTSTQVQSIYDATSAGLTKDLSTIEPSNLKYWNRMGD
jgi:hypothetical protein